MVIFGSFLLLGLFLYHMDVVTFLVLCMYHAVALVMEIQETRSKFLPSGKY